MSNKHTRALERAAPDLLAALKTLSDDWHDFHNECAICLGCAEEHPEQDCIVHEPDCPVDAAEKAIAKAEGTPSEGNTK